MREEHILITNFNGNPNVGLFGYCGEDFCLLGQGIPKRVCKEVEKILKVPVHKISIAGTSLIGVFCVGNKNGILIPSIAFEHEMKKLDELGIKYSLIDTKLTALGNNILINDDDKIGVLDNEFNDKKYLRFSQIESQNLKLCKKLLAADNDVEKLKEIFYNNKNEFQYTLGNQYDNIEKHIEKGTDDNWHLHHAAKWYLSDSDHQYMLLHDDKIEYFYPGMTDGKIIAFYHTHCYGEEPSLTDIEGSKWFKMVYENPTRYGVMLTERDVK